MPTNKSKCTFPVMLAWLVILAIPAVQASDRELSWFINQSGAALAPDGVVDGSYLTQGGEFEFFAVGIDESAIAETIVSRAQLSLPSTDSMEGLRAVVTSIDVRTSADGTPVYSGDVLDPKSEEIIGRFSYAHAKGSHPYLYVRTHFEVYEILAAATSLQGASFVLKRATGEVAVGRTDPTDEEWTEILARRALDELENPTINATLIDSEVLSELSSSGGASQQSASSCTVDLGIGYSNAAYNRNNSIASSIVTWASILNNSIQDIGVNCQFQLLGPKKFTYYVEKSDIVQDLYHIDNDNTATKNWKNNTVNADLFVLITSNGEPHTDDYHGVALTFGGDSLPCGTTYEINRGCGQWAIVRDDYAIYMRTLEHEVGHLVGLSHNYAYGGWVNRNDPLYLGAGFSATNNSSEVGVSAGRFKSTTIMSNPEVFCSASYASVNTANCGYRLPFFASQSKARIVVENGVTRYRYFPEFYRDYESNPYSSGPSMASTIDAGMQVSSTFQ